MMVEVVLTVSESKRLIAKGVAHDERVRTALDRGIVAVAKGTTNAYIVEELLGKAIDKTHYVTGNTVPAGRKGVALNASHPDLVLKDGELLEGKEVTSIVAEMRRGDVFIKGANALNYDRRQAGVLVGHGTGGTLGATLGTVISRKITFITPVGLEKSIPGDLDALARLIAAGQDVKPPVCSLWVTPGEIFTEIEAVKTLWGLGAFACGSGGVAGAEGSTRLLLAGEEDSIKRAFEALDSIQGEPPFVG